MQVFGEDNSGVDREDNRRRASSRRLLGVGCIRVCGYWVGAPDCDCLITGVSAFSYLRTKSFNGSSVEGINARSAEPWIGKHNSMPSMNPSRLTKPISKAVSSKSQGRGESASATAPQSFRGDGLSSPNRPRRDQPRQPNWQRRVKSALPLPVLGS